MQEYFGFTVSRVLPEVLYWSRGQLEWMCDYGILEQQGYVLDMEGPTTNRRRSPEGDATTNRIAVKAQRIGRPPGTAPEFLGQVMQFEFASDGGSTRVWARCAEGYAAIQVLFEDFLKQIEEQYPGVGPLCQHYRARQEQQQIERIEKHLRMEAAGVTTAVAGALEMAVSDASTAAQFPPTYGTGAVAAEASGPLTTTDLEDPEIRERKVKLMELWKVGCRRCDAARKLTLSESTVKRLSKELGINWRTPRAKR